MRTVPRKKLALMLSVSALSAGGCINDTGVGRTVVGKPLSGTGAVDVTVTARPKIATENDRERVTTYDAAPIHAKPTGPFEHVDYSHLNGLIVWLEAAAKVDAVTPLAAVTMRVSADEEANDVFPVSVGQNVVIKNGTGRGASFYSVSEGNEFQIESAAAGSLTRITIQAEGLVEVWSDPAKPPVAMWYAAPTPWVAATHSERTVRFEGVPPGRYVATGWHARLPISAREVDVKADTSMKATVTAGVGALSEAGSGSDSGSGEKK